ncbi:hypothetical protein GEV33_012505 [Tenebrio molitor]|uniref:Ig-like domain-containing protein n=1 Tax=Tenebrio molitor TaxID=7067 RepID=A0A8J6H9M7_TENMO|nr:hypothetical protein GEV33_012505 [Tenebrio molitor]
MQTSINFGTGVKINKLQVPEVIKHGASVILDCDFTLEDREEDLVVKWYFNKNKTLVYQWIPALKPQGLGILKDRLNLEYAASVDANSVHRALHILKAVPDLSGDYTCSVSTLQSEDIRTKSMLVFEFVSRDVARNQFHPIRSSEKRIHIFDNTNTESLDYEIYMPIPLHIHRHTQQHLYTHGRPSRRADLVVVVERVLILPSTTLPSAPRRHTHTSMARRRFLPWKKSSPFGGIRTH